jgi:predicted kinase
MDNSFVMLIGLPGCGKSTRALDILKRNPRYIIISSDTFIEDAAAKDSTDYQTAFLKYRHEAERHCYSEARKAFANGISVIWDQTNLDVDTRAERLRLVPAGYFKAAITFELDKEELVDRFVARFKETGKMIPIEVMNSLEASYQRPGRYEGFDHIEIVEC